MIRYSEQLIDKKDIESVVKVLKSKFLTTGPVVKKFERHITKKINAKFGVSFNSATSALHVACIALGLNKNDYLWTSVNTFVASSNCALYCGAKVDFVDIEMDSYNLDLDKLEKKLFLTKKKNKKLLPKIIVPVVFSGNSIDMKRLKKLSLKYKFFILEDASHAYGAKYSKEYIGSGKYSDITVFSFHPLKIITTCEGGLATTKNKYLYEKMQILKSHGIDKNNFVNSKKYTKNPHYYEQKYLGYNYRLNEVEAVLGISQTNKFSKYIKLRRSIAKYYDINLDTNFLNLPKENKFSYSSYHLYIIYVKGNSNLRDKLINYLKIKKIQTNLHYIPLHFHPYYKKLNYLKNKEFENAENYFTNALSIPIHPGLCKKDQKYIVDNINNFFRRKK